MISNKGQKRIVLATVNPQVSINRLKGSAEKFFDGMQNIPGVAHDFAGVQQFGGHFLGSQQCARTRQNHIPCNSNSNL